MKTSIGVLMALVGLGSGVEGAEAPSSAVTLTVYVSGVRSASGVIRAGMCADPKNYPGCPHTVIADARAGRVKLEFSLAPGTYAFYGMHDENNNGKMDLVQGFPTEGFAFGNDALGQSGVPTFQSASTEVKGDAVIRVKMVYMERPQ